MMGGLIGGSLMDRRLVRTDDVRVAVQDARTGAARLPEGDARHAGAPHHAAHRAAREAALTVPLWRPPASTSSNLGALMANPPNDPAQLLASLLEGGQAMLRPFGPFGMPSATEPGKSGPDGGIHRRNADGSPICSRTSGSRCTGILVGGSRRCCRRWRTSPSKRRTSDRRFAAEAWRNDPRFDADPAQLPRLFAASSRTRSSRRRWTRRPRRRWALACASWSMR